MKLFYFVSFCLMGLKTLTSEDLWDTEELPGPIESKFTDEDYDDVLSDDIITDYQSDGEVSRYQSCLNRIRTEDDTVIDSNETPYLEDDVLSNRDSDVFRSGVVRMQLWKSARVPVLLGKISKRKKELLKCAVLFFYENTCINFVKKKSTDVDYLYITENHYKGGCFANSLGNAGGPNVINLDKYNNNCWKHGTIIHELMHGLGFYHEQSRNDRDKYVEINWDVIPKRSKKQFETAREQGFDQTLVGQYDYESVMHYTRFPFDSVTPVMTAKVEPISANNAKMGNREAPTQMDAFKLNALYCGAEEKNSNKELCETGFVTVKTDFTFTEYYQTPDVDDVNPWKSRRCDWKQGHSRGNYWIKLEGSGGSNILDRRPESTGVCGTSWPGYIIGEHPQRLYEIVHRKMCYYNVVGDGCSSNTADKSIEILKCADDQFLYKIKGSPHCYMAFCTVPKHPPGKKSICDGSFRTVQTDHTFTVNYTTPDLGARPWKTYRRCDWRDGNANGRWMKLQGEGGTRILNYRPSSPGLCGTTYPGYIVGTHPVKLYQSVYRKLCYYTGHRCSSKTNDKSIEIMKCGHKHFLYRITGSPHCYLAFCTMP